MKRYIQGKMQYNSKGQKGILLLNDYWINNLNQLVICQPLAVISDYRYVFSHIPSYLQKYNIPIFFFDNSELELISGAASLTIDLLTNTINKSDGLNLNDGLLLNECIESFSVKTSIKGTKNKMSFDCGADGIGLISTEFLFLDSPMMNEKVYRAGLEKIMTAHPKTEYVIRLFDFNYDKFPVWFQEKYNVDNYKYYKGRNFFLIDEMDDLLTMQLSSLIELSKKHNISILLPYINSTKEVNKIKNTINSFGTQININIGIMLETVAAIYEIDTLSQSVDFFSIGTNDLIQSFFGIDRTDIVSMEQINFKAHSLVNLLKFALINANSKQIKICGQLPIIPGMLKALVSLGYTDFTVSPQWVPFIKHKLKSMV